MEEVWKDIKGFEGIYQISNYGRIRSLDRMFWNNYNNKHQKIPGKLLKGKITKSGYHEVALTDENKKRYYLLVHRIVAQEFLFNPENKNQINHKNGVKNDNRVENLEWCTSKENNQHAIDIRLAKLGSERSDSKLTDSQVLEIRELFATREYSFSELGRMFKVDGAGIGRIIKGLTWKHLPIVEYDFDIDTLERKRKKRTLVLTEEQISEAQSMVESGLSKRKVAEHFGITHTTINRMLKERAL